MYESFKWAKTCHFGAPWPPMHATIILEPLDVDENPQHEVYVQLQRKISIYLKELDTDGTDITYIQFLQELHITHELYILVLCSTLRKPRLFPKRNKKDSIIKASMKDLVMARQTNQDIHYILDSYSCVTYICDYMTKAQKGMSALIA